MESSRRRANIEVGCPPQLRWGFRLRIDGFTGRGTNGGRPNQALLGRLQSDRDIYSRARDPRKASAPSTPERIVLMGFSRVAGHGRASTPASMLSTSSGKNRRAVRRLHSVYPDLPTTYATDTTSRPVSRTLTARLMIITGREVQGLCRTAEGGQARRGADEYPDSQQSRCGLCSASPTVTCFRQCPDRAPLPYQGRRSGVLMECRHGKPFGTAMHA